MKRTTQQINADIYSVEHSLKLARKNLLNENHPTRKQTLIKKIAILKNTIISLEKERLLLGQIDLFD